MLPPVVACTQEEHEPDYSDDHTRCVCEGSGSVVLDRIIDDSPIWYDDGEAYGVVIIGHVSRLAALRRTVRSVRFFMEPREFFGEHGDAQPFVVEHRLAGWRPAKYRELDMYLHFGDGWPVTWVTW